MRTALFVLLAGLIMLALLPSNMIRQTGSIRAAESRTSLINAFEAVQEADKLGASSDQTASLSSQLNTALSYYNTAIELSTKNNTGSEYYMTLSNTASALVLDKALVLQSQAQADRTTQQVLAYTIAIASSIASSWLVLESHRIRNFIRRKRLFTTRLRLGDQDGKEN